MAANTATKLLAHRGPRLLQRMTSGFHAFSLAAVLIAVSALAGCGSGNVSSTDVQPSAGTQPTSTQPSSAQSATGSASLTWAAPTTNTDGTPLTDLAGFKVYYGTTPGVYQSIDVGAATSYEITGLDVGQTYYFTVTAYDTAGVESNFASTVSKLIN